MTKDEINERSVCEFVSGLLYTRRRKKDEKERQVTTKDVSDRFDVSSTTAIKRLRSAGFIQKKVSGLHCWGLSDSLRGTPLPNEPESWVSKIMTDLLGFIPWYSEKNRWFGKEIKGRLIRVEYKIHSISFGSYDNSGLGVLTFNVHSQVRIHPSYNHENVSITIKFPGESPEIEKLERTRLMYLIHSAHETTLKLASDYDYNASRSLELC